MSTIRDVARLANVSIATVSRVLNNDTTYKTTTRTKEAILEAVRQLNYTPNPAYTKKRVVSASTAKIGCVLNMVTENFQDKYFMSIFAGIESVIEKNGYDLVLIHAPSELNSNNWDNILKNQNYKGIIFLITPPILTLKKLHQRIRHIVGVETAIDRIDNICYNRYNAGCQAMQYLIDCGHQKIGFIGSNMDASPSYILGRYGAYRLMMNEYDLKINIEWIIDCKWQHELCFQKVTELLTLQDRPTALFVSSDYMAMAAISAINSAGLKVPDDISIISISNIESSKYTTPPLTTISVPQLEMGTVAANILLERINGDKTLPKQVSMPTELVIRESVKRLR